VTGSRPGRIGVIGLGNVLMGDDAFGPWVAQVLLAEYEFPPGVSVEDLGTPGLDLIPYVADLEALVLVDTVRSDGPPGTIRLYRRDALLKHAPEARLSPHDPGVKEALLTAEFAGVGPREVLLVGAVPMDSAMGVRLSPPLREAVPLAVAEVLRELARLGWPAARRSAPGRADIWWEAEALPQVELADVRRVVR
jgi:hydrogenase maturation protease